MQDLTVSIIQSDLVWEDKAANFDNFQKKIEGIKEDTDLIILPEMFSTGFSMKPEIFADKNGDETLSWMREQASKKNAALAGSVMVSEDGNFFNRLFFVLPDGDFHYYDKRHLFSMGGEDNHFTPGEREVVIDFKGWKIKLLICYDLRFPVWAKNRFDNGKYEYDLLLTVANWPAVRSRVWETLLSARAIENQAFVVGVNRIGNDGNGLPHSGNSNVYDAKGLPLLDDNENREFTATVRLSYSGLREFRDKFTVGYDWDVFGIDFKTKQRSSGDRYSDKKSQTGYDG